MISFFNCEYWSNFLKLLWNLSKGYKSIKVESIPSGASKSKIKLKID